MKTTRKLRARKMTKDDTATCIMLLSIAKWRGRHVYIGRKGGGTIRPAENVAGECIAALKRQLGE